MITNPDHPDHPLHGLANERKARERRKQTRQQAFERRIAASMRHAHILDRLDNGHAETPPEPDQNGSSSPGGEA